MLYLRSKNFLDKGNVGAELPDKYEVKMRIYFIGAELSDKELNQIQHLVICFIGTGLSDIR